MAAQDGQKAATTRPRQSCLGSSAAPQPAGASSGVVSAVSASSSASQPPIGTLAAQRAGLTQALEELARGERTADKLELELGAFEAKLDQLLGLLGVSEEDLEDEGGVDDGDEQIGVNGAGDANDNGKQSTGNTNGTK
ncbi:hypothetical protein CMQ_8268 [Grosmannia clavigera kw1407]|uniref:Uncharacterized protein n=1 Tax=Grosmannia clavigera (strain kw1407 / UAMH 11150) TaxID=655863 RepID=F0XKR7_GROCL|nr:uncharacterized protein CMQ_8268 [Grosmannia clavigera kw1407]EFX01802.1 hypothetical protein CMQ_8268 [Grosmannia clavigera kw1407]